MECHLFADFVFVLPRIATCNVCSPYSFPFAILPLEPVPQTRGDPSASRCFQTHLPSRPLPRSSHNKGERRISDALMGVFSSWRRLFSPFDEHLRPSSRASSLLFASTWKMEGTATLADLKKLKVGGDDPQEAKGSDSVAHGRRWS